MTNAIANLVSGFDADSSADYLVTTAAKLEVLEYSKAWENGTGYFDGACKGESAPTLDAGEAKAFITLGGRVGIIIGLPKPVGVSAYNAIFFTRFTDGNVVVSNMPTQALAALTRTSSALSLDTVMAMLGDPTYETVAPNIGTRLANYVASLQA